jgi:2,3-bisphosphoglycerate-independent phosphoglycerate mutase
MTVLASPSNLEEEFSALADHYAQYDFFYLHVKQTLNWLGKLIINK